MHEPAIHPVGVSVRGLAVARGGEIVTEDVSFELRPGAAVVLRGANGAGKTSVLRAIAGFAHVAAGCITFRDDAREIDPADVRAEQIALIGHRNGVKPALSAHENLVFEAAFHGGGTAPDQALEAVGLVGLGGVPAGILSAGQQRRLALARLVLTKRALWLLDEPTAALDAAGMAMLAALIADHRAHGGGVVLSGHDAFAPEGADLVRIAAAGTVPA